MTLLQEARAAGLVVKAQGDRLTIRGPRRAEPIAQRLIAHKAEVLAALTGGQPNDLTSPVDPLGPTTAPQDLPPDWWVEWDERAAIMEYEGGLPRERAEAMALDDVLRQMRRLGTRKS